MRTTWTFHSAGKLIFGRDACLQLGDVAGRLGIKRVLLITDSNLIQAGLLDRVHPPLSESGIAVEVFPGGEPEPTLRAAEKAIQLDPLSAESYEALGGAYAREAHWDQAEKSFRRSMELQPGRQESHGYFAMYYLLPLGRVDEAIRQLQIAEKSEPIFRWFLGDALADVGRNEEAAVVCNKLPPDYSLRSQCIPGLMARQGKAAEVIQMYGTLPDNPTWIRSALGCAYARAGRRDEAERVAASYSNGAGLPYAAVLFACLGDKDRVFETLDRVAQIGPIRMAWFLLRADRENPGLLNGDPRLRALRKKVGLPEK